MVVLIAWGGLGIVRTVLRWWSTRYLVTSEEVYRKTGLVSRTVRNFRLGEIQNTAFTQSWLGRLASYGTVRIATAGTSGVDLAFERVADPDAVVGTITEQIDRIEDRGS